LVQPGDYLEIRNGIDDSAEIIKNFTNKPDLNERWSSSGSCLWIRFESDEEIVSSGFNLAFTVEKKLKGMN